MRNSHSWARNLKNVAPQKQNSIFKTRAQYAIRNCAFKLFKAHCTATIKTKNASLKKKICKPKERKRNFIKAISWIGRIQTWDFRILIAVLNHHAISAN
jgi:hypothetical protein